MKGGILEWPLAIAVLVFIGMFVIALVGAFYIRTLAAGPPVQVTTYTEYRWMNFLPSSALFALTHSSSSWDAMNKIALYDGESTPQLIKHSELMSHYSGLDYFSDSAAGLASFDKDLSVVEDSFNDGSSVKKEFYLVKDSDGLSLIYGMDRILSGIKPGESMAITFPDSYPYKCSQMEIPVFSSVEGKENTRINLVVCCQQIKSCGDYMAEAGRAECSITDPCGVGPCMIIQPAGQDRMCVQNFPPKVTLEIRAKGSNPWSSHDFTLSYAKGQALDVEYRINVTDDSTVKEITIDFGDGAPENVPVVGSEVASETSSSSNAQDRKSSFLGTHTYEKTGDYTVRCKVWDDAESQATAEIAVKAISG